MQLRDILTINTFEVTTKLPRCSLFHFARANLTRSMGEEIGRRPYLCAFEKRQIRWLEISTFEYYRGIETRNARIKRYYLPSVNVNGFGIAEL